MTRQTTVRLPEDLADQAEAVARVRGTSINAVIVESLKAEIDRAKRLLERDRELLERLAR
jgi:predicted transcriptional regulator